MANNPDTTLCAVCSALKAVETAYQKFGWEETNTHLPAQAGQLVLVHDLRPGSSRKLHLLQCPLCQTYYLYQTDYEYLVNGSEDEERLERLALAQVQEIMRLAGLEDDLPATPP